MSHQHGPNCNHGPHGHPPGRPQGMPVNMLDPALRALLDEQPVRTVPFAIVEMTLPMTTQVQEMVTCAEHKKINCPDCDVNFHFLNYMQQFMRNAPEGAIPPPPNMPPNPVREEAIKKVKEEGNTAFKADNFTAAVKHYTQAADMALSRPPWEPARISRDEAAIMMCNRSAAYAAASNWVEALADAQLVVRIKKDYMKGYFRLARALIGLERLADARWAILEGLQVERDNKELNALLEDVEARIDLDWLIGDWDSGRWSRGTIHSVYSKH